MITLIVEQTFCWDKSQNQCLWAKCLKMIRNEQEQNRLSLIFTSQKRFSMHPLARKLLFKNIYHFLMVPLHMVINTKAHLMMIERVFIT